jgi:glycosyltransferase involved in cell wall biosynthesis
LKEKKIVAILLPDLGGGGAERVSINLSNFFILNGFSVHFVLMQKNGEFNNAISENIQIFCINRIRFRNSIFPLASYFKKNKPHFILVNMWPLTSIAALAWLLSGRKGKLFLVEHSNLSNAIINSKFVKEFYLKFFIKVTYPLADKVIGVSKGVIEDVILLGQLNRDKTMFIYNPITDKNAVRSNNKIPSFWEDSKFRILSVGRFVPEKNHKLLIKSFEILCKSVSDVKLIILGNGPLFNETKEFVLKLGLEKSIHMPGFILDTKTYFHHADLFVLSSKFEGFGNVIVEALSYGIPVISTNCPDGPSEILEGGKYGTLVSIEDEEGLAEAMKINLFEEVNKEFLKNRSLDFSIDKMAQKYLELFI